MALHGSYQHLFRHFEEVGRKGAVYRARVFAEIGNLFQECLIRQQVPAGGCRGAVNLAADDLLADQRIRDDKVAFAFVKVLSEGGDREGGISHETMAPGNSAAFDRAEAERDDNPVEEGNDPVDRPGKADIEIAPAHRLFKRNVADQPRQYFSQELVSRPAGLLLDSGDIFALVSRNQGQRADVDTLAAGKTLSCLGRFAVGAKGDGFRRAHGCGLGIWLECRNVGYMENETARRGQSPDAAEGQPGALQLFADQPFHVCHCFGEKPGRYLFRSYLKKKFFRAHQILPPFSIG